MMEAPPNVRKRPSSLVFSMAWLGLRSAEDSFHDAFVPLSSVARERVRLAKPCEQNCENRRPIATRLFSQRP